MRPKVALVTGGARGIGRATAVRLAAQGCHVIVNYPSEADGPGATLDEVRAHGGVGTGILADVGVPSELHAMFDQIEADVGGVDVLVNNAGICPFQRFREIDEATWDRIHSVNLKGAFICSQRAAASMIANGRGGRIVSVSSISAHLGGLFESAYGATKSGIKSLMQSLCLELGPYGITCNSVSPGVVDTDINTEAFRDQSLRQRCIERIPVGRLGLADEIAAVIGFLAGADASFINGAEIIVDGGMLVNPL